MKRRGFLKAIAGAAAAVGAIALPTPKAKAKPVVSDDELRLDSPLCVPGLKAEYTTAYTTRIIADCTRAPDQRGFIPTLELRKFPDASTIVVRGGYVNFLPKP